MKFLVVGCGSMGKRRIGHLKSLSLDDILCFDIREDRRNEVEEKFGVKSFDSIDKALNDNPDAIFVCVPPACHFQYLKIAVEKSKHVFIEKPISNNLDGLDDVIKISKTYGKIAMASFNNRFHPCIMKVKEIVDSGKIGKVLTGTADIGEYLPNWHPWEDYRIYYPSIERLGGWLDAVCELDWLIWILGDIKTVGCLARKLSTLDIDTNDVMEYILEFKSGSVIGMHTDMIQQPYNRSCKFIGEKGTVIWDGVDSTVKLYNIKHKKFDIFKCDGSRKKIEECYLNETKHFINCINGKEKILNSLEDEKVLLDIVLKSLESSKDLIFKDV